MVDISDAMGYSEMLDAERVPGPNGFLIERHRPTRFRAPYHHHMSIELNYLRDCRMQYSFSGKPVLVPPDRITLFWGGAPHRVTDVDGTGTVTNVYLSLGQFLRWTLPAELVEAILADCVIVARPNLDIDENLFDRLYAERTQENAAWLKLHMAEIENRLRRMALEGWDELLGAPEGGRRTMAPLTTMRHAGAMLRFIADNFSRPIGVAEIIGSANLSQGHAMKLFKQIMGRSIKEHLTRTRLSHARMLLSDSGAKIVNIAFDSGFRSLSSFYEAFVAEHGISPGRYRKNVRNPKAVARFDLDRGNADREPNPWKTDN